MLKKLLLMLVLLCAPVMAQVSFDSVGPGATGAAGTGVNTLSWNHTVGTGSNRLLTVQVALGKNPDTGLSLSVTYNGVSLTPGSSPIHSNNMTSGFTQIFYLINPPSGTFSVIVSVSGGTVDLEGGSISFIGVNQTTPVRNVVSATGAGTAPSVTVSSSASDMVFSSVVNGSPIDSSGNTLRWLKNQNSGTAGGEAAASTAAGASSVVMSYTVNSDWWAIIGADVLAASQVARVTVPTQIRSVTSLPATCNPGNGIVPTDVVSLISSGVSALYFCSAQNVWSAL